MPSNEKELKCHLFDQLSILEDLEEIAEKEKAEETIEAFLKGNKSVLLECIIDPLDLVK